MASLDLAKPGGKEILLFGGGALGLALIYFALNKSKTTAPAPGTGTPNMPGANNQSFLPGNQSPTGNAFTDTLFTTPMTPSPGQTAIAGMPPPVFTPMTPRIAAGRPAMGAQSILGGGEGGGSGGGSGGGGAPSGGSITNLTGGTSPLQWATDVLKAGGFPTTAANLQSLVAWALNEGGGGANNPLNTTQPAPGATTFNSVGVRNYPNVATGVTATVQTLMNGLYSNIVADLKSGGGITSNAGSELSKWSGGGYSSLSGTWARAAGLIVAPKAPKVTVSPGVKAASPATVAGLMPKVTPAANRTPLAKPRPVGLKPSTGRLVLSFQSVWKKIFPPAPRKPAYRPTPLRGPGHPLLH